MSIIQKIKESDRANMIKETLPFAHNLFQVDGEKQDLKFKWASLMTLLENLKDYSPELIDELYNEIFGDKE